jgi:hypothetical protein
MYLAHVNGDQAPGPGETLHGSDESERFSAQVVNARVLPEGGCDLLAVIATDSARSVPEAGVRLDDGRRLALKSLPYAVDGD